MASGDSVENVLQRQPPLLSRHVHRVSELDEQGEPFRRLVESRIEETDCREKALVIRTTRRKIQGTPRETEPRYGLARGGT
jgi:hypothetical protein